MVSSSSPFGRSIRVECRCRRRLIDMRTTEWRENHRQALPPHHNMHQIFYKIGLTWTYFPMVVVLFVGVVGRCGGKNYGVTTVDGGDRSSRWQIYLSPLY